MIVYACLVVAALASAATKNHNTELELAAKVGALLASKKQSKELSDIENAAKGLSSDDRLSFIVIALELAEQAETRIKKLKPCIIGHSEYAKAHPFLLYSLAEALASEGDIAGAETLLSQFSSVQSSEIDQADMYSVRTRMALQQKQMDAAKRNLGAARQAMAKAVPEDTYRTWRTQVVEHRLKKMAGLLKTASNTKKPDPSGGPAYQAWLKADKAHDISAYQQVVASYPETVFADASLLEAARMQFDAGQVVPCLKMLDNPRLQKGALGVPAGLLKGDVLLVQGKSLTLKEVRAAYDKALALLKEPKTPEELTAEEKSAIQPQQPLHRFHNSYNTWFGRQPGNILIPGMFPVADMYYRYQLLLRLAALNYAEGKSSDAATLAESLALFDDVDREMVQQGRGAGGIVLANVFTTHRFFLPLECFKCEPPSVYAQLLVAVAFFHVYDFDQANLWLSRTLKEPKFSSKEARDAATMLLATSENMQWNSARALTLAGQIQLPKGVKVTAPFYYARQMEWTILHMQKKPDYPAAMAAMQQVLDRAPSDNEFAQRALLCQAQLSMNFDLDLSKKLFERFSKLYPGVYTNAIQSFLKEISQKKEGRVNS